MNIYLLLASLIPNITVELTQEEKQIFTSYRPQRFELNETASEELKAEPTYLFKPMYATLKLGQDPRNAPEAITACSGNSDFDKIKELLNSNIQEIENEKEKEDKKFEKELKEKQPKEEKDGVSEEKQPKEEKDGVSEEKQPKKEIKKSERSNLIQSLIDCRNENKNSEEDNSITIVIDSEIFHSSDSETVKNMCLEKIKPTSIDEDAGMSTIRELNKNLDSEEDEKKKKEMQEIIDCRKENATDFNSEWFNDFESKIYIDSNNDNDLTNDGDGLWVSKSSRTFNTEAEIDLQYRSSKQIFSYKVKCYKMATSVAVKGKDSVLCYRWNNKSGIINWENQKYKIALADENTDGLFDDLNNVALSIDRNQDGKLNGSTSSAEGYKANQLFELGGISWKVDSINESGTKITLKKSEKEAPDKPYLTEGNKSPDFSFISHKGKKISLEKLKGKVVLIDFWATWCGPCIRMAPEIQELYNQLEGPNFVMLGISLDTSEEKLNKYLEDNPEMRWEEHFDGKGWDNEISEIFRVNSIPTMYLIDQNGIIAKQKAYPSIAIKDDVEKLLQEYKENKKRKNGFLF